MGISKFTFIVFILVLSVVSCNKKTNSPEISKPNVLLFYMDDLRPELGCYGASQIHSPNIDALAKSGILFNSAYCNVSVCGASRASMLTGIRPTKNIYLDYNTFVEKEKPEAVSLPKLFKKNGYTTISNGKIYHHLDDNEGDWDEVYRPYAFDENKTGLEPTDYWQSLWKDYHLPENIKIYRETDKGPAFEKASVTDSTYIDGIMAQKVIRDLKKLRNSNKPFFLTAGFISPHLPFNAPEKYWNLYPESTIRQPYNNYVAKNAPKVSISNWGEMRAYTNIPKKGPVNDSIAKKLIHGYYATVSYVDILIGEIMATLEDQGLYENTIVVLVSDHGYNLQEHTQWAKFTSHRTSMKVPLIIANPKLLNPSTTDALVELVDIYPTLAELCRLETPKDQLEGKSLVPILENPKLKGKEHVFIKNSNGFTIKTAAYCYTEYINPDNNKTFARMLYDHTIDKDENFNVVDAPEYSEIVKRLKHLLHSNYKNNITGEEIEMP